MISNPLIAFLYLFPYYVFLVLVPAIIYTRLRKKYFRKKIKHFILDNFTKDIKNKYLTLIIYSIVEEILFRYFPYAYFGLLGVIIGSVIWAILHVPNREYETKLKLICLCYYLSSAVFYVYALTVNLLMPLIYHIMHNLMCEYLEHLHFKKLEKEVSKSGIVRKKQPEKLKSVEYRKVKIKVPYPIEYVRTKTKEIEYEVEEPVTFEYVKVKL